MQVLKMMFVVVAVAVAACGPKLPPTMSPEAKLAVRGTQITEALRATLPAIKATTCVDGVPVSEDAKPVVRTCLRPADAIKVVEQIQKASVIAQDLGKVLIVIDNSTLVDDKVSNTQKAKQILADIQKALTEAVALPIDPAARNAIVGIFSTVTTLLFTLF